ncbi:MAG: restriction endonuclease subunit S, partial [Planctomycetaceae bacterium]|nr:restriction endonuclease subunit S [Planctomycetaceae bacterium]
MPTTLGECADWISGSTPSKNRASYWDGSIPWISAKDMKQFRLYDSEDHVTDLAIQDGTRIAPEGSILVLVRGMTLHNDLPICLCTAKMTFNQDVKALRPKPHVWGEYLAYWLLANKPFLRTLVDSASHGTGRIHTNILQGVELNLPSFDEQRAIARVLGALDDKIDLSRQMNETLEAMARA